MTNFQLHFKSFGERSILIEWPPRIDELIQKDMLSFKSFLQNNDNKLILEIKHAYNSILVSYLSAIDNVNDEILRLKSLYLHKKNQLSNSKLLWKIPVCYDDAFAIDLEDLTVQKGCSKAQIVRLHIEAIYTVFFIGFLPGFLYLEGLNTELHFPRKSTPRSTVEKGAVGIGGSQTGIYPNTSPGGWNIIGNSPVLFFDARKTKPCFAEAGDKIRFIPIALNEYREISLLVENGTYNIESEIIDG